MTRRADKCEKLARDIKATEQDIEELEAERREVMKGMILIRTKEDERRVQAIDVRLTGKKARLATLNSQYRNTCA